MAIVSRLLEVFGADLGVGYDIGCQFTKTLARSPLGEKAEGLSCKLLIPAFHGYAHNRLCQLVYLATYVLGLGMEDLETSERFFSRSNALASAVRYASCFHRLQRIFEYLKHKDAFETYANLSMSLINVFDSPRPNRQ